MGDPGQTAEVLVDINYPTTIIFNENTGKYVNKTYNYNISGYPWYLNPFYDQTASSTYL